MCKIIWHVLDDLPITIIDISVEIRLHIFFSVSLDSGSKQTHEIQSTKIKETKQGRLLLIVKSVYIKTKSADVVLQTNTILKHEQTLDQKC